MEFKSHPDSNAISAYVEGGLKRSVRRGLEAHLSICTECRELTACASIALHQPTIRRQSNAWWWQGSLAVAASAILVAGAVWWMPQTAGNTHHTLTASAATTVSPTVTARVPQRPMAPILAAAAVAAPAQWAHIVGPAPALSEPALPSQPQTTVNAALDFASLRPGFRDQGALQTAPRSLVNWGGVTSVPAGAMATNAAMVVVPPLQAALPPVGTEAAWPMASGFAGTDPSMSPSPSSPQLAAELGWAISRGGALLKSVTAGLWREVPFVPGVQVRTIYVRGDHVWAGGDANELFTSTDHGKHWLRVVLPGLPAKTVVLRSIVFLDAQHGVITAQNGQSWTSNDGGQTWVPR